MQDIKHKRTRLLLLALFIAFAAAAMLMNSSHIKQQSAVALPPRDTLKRSLPVYLRYYPYVHYVYNYIQWHHLQEVHTLFGWFGETVNRRLTVLHIGDSHIQADVFTGHIREQMQRTFGAGGRGLVFPYDAANTHSTLDYRTQAWGKWLYAKNINQFPKYDLGITGATVRSEDSTAGFRFIFKPGIIRDHFRNIKIFCKTSDVSYNLLVTSSKQDEPIYVRCSNASLNGVVEFQLPHISDTIEFRVVKDNASQLFFECYGILIESTSKTGVLYNSVGINGAGYKSILRQNLMPQQLKVLRPDLVILDLGANDFFQTDIDTSELKSNLQSILKMIRSSCPNAFIVISNSQDIKCKLPNSCGVFSELTRKIAFKEKCLFYDYYNISGGRNSMLKWSADSLVKKDLIHLSKGGYQLKGELYLNGILNSYQTFLNTPDADSFIIEAFANRGKPDTLQKTSSKQGHVKDSIVPADVNARIVYYKIKAGDALSKIAVKHGVRTKDLMQWNNITSKENIKEGKMLIIYLPNEQY